MKKMKLYMQLFSSIDLYLILFLSLFFVYSAISIFTQTTNNIEFNTINVIIRSSNMAIFSYFISNNFIQKSKEKRKNDTTKIIMSQQQIQARIITFFGLLSFVFLCVVQMIQTFTPESIAMISQLRDFVVASISYLISYASTNKR